MLPLNSLALIFFGLLAYINAIHHPFVHDDVIFILHNPHITDLAGWYQAFRPSPALGGLNTYYRPLLELLYRLEFHFLGPHPYGYHFINISVHIINGLLLFRLLKKLGFLNNVAWVVSLLFLIHPVQTEAVSCISGISNLIMALGVLLALLAYLNKWTMTSLLCFVVAFLCKEQAVMFLPLVMVVDHSQGKKDFRSWIFWGLVICALLWFRQQVTGTSLFKDITVSPGELYLRLAAVPRDIGMYLRLIFFPNDLHYYRSTDILQSNTVAWAMALIFLSGVIYSLKRWPRSKPTLLLGLGWFLAALLPVMNIVPLINEYSLILTPEHFLYLPIVGILLIVVVAVDRILKHFRKPLLGAVIGSCLLLTWHQNTFWKSEIVLFKRMLIFEPDFGRGHLLLAKAYFFDGHPEQAEEHFKKAYAIMSSYAKKATNMTARDFYLRYMDEIAYYQARNESILPKRRM